MSHARVFPLYESYFNLYSKFSIILIYNIFLKFKFYTISQSELLVFSLKSNS
jgi:hypothetical protein